jgi:DNA-binding response OmpR family regulator
MDAKKKKVLCIEDEYFIGELYTRALQKAGYEPKVVISGDEGLKEALTNQYDIILVDIMIPGQSGLEVVAHVKKQQPPITAKIVILTNMQQEDSARQQIEKQVDGYMIKAEATPKEIVQFLDTL